MENVSIVTNLLQIPESAAMFNGQIKNKKTYSLVELETLDFTKMTTNLSTGKKEPTKTSVFVIESATTSFGAYSLNMISNYLHGYGHEYVSSTPTTFEMSKPEMTFTRDGKLYWIGWQEASISPTTGGYNFTVLSKPGMNVDKLGNPVLNDPNYIPIGILKRTYAKTTSATPTTFSKSYPTYTMAELMRKSNMSESQIANATKVEFFISPTSGETHCNSLCTFVDTSTSSVVGIPYINGQQSSSFNFRNLISSYGQKLPDFVTRWKLFHPSSASGMFGAAWSKQMTSSQDTQLKLSKGNSISYDQATNTLTYITGSKLVFDFEFLPAQGKNETWGTSIDLDTMIKSVYA